MRLGRLGHHALAAATSVFGIDMPVDKELGWDDIELLGDVFTDASHFLMAIGAVVVGQVMEMIDTG